MSTRHPYSLASWLCVVALALAGCGRGDSAPASNASGSGAPHAGFPRTVALPDGTELRLEDRPKRVVLANTTTVDLAMPWLAPERVAALCEHAFEWSGLAFTGDRFKARPTFPRFVSEVILAQSPDLVLCSTHNQPDTLAVLRNAGVPLVCFGHPTSLDEVRSMLRLTARVLGADDEAKAFERGLDQRIARLRERAGKLPRLSALFYNYYGTQGRTNGANTLAQTAIELAGMTNAAASLDGPVALSFERLLAMDPDVLIVSQTLDEASASTEAMVRAESTLTALRALGEGGAVIPLHPAYYSCASQLVIDAAERIADLVDQQLAAGTLRARTTPDRKPPSGK